MVQKDARKPVNKKSRLVYFLIMSLFPSIAFAQIVAEADTLVRKETTEYCITVKSLGYHFKRPPFMEIYFNFELENKSASPKWFIILEKDTAKMPRNIKTTQVQVDKFCGSGCSAIYESVGPVSFFAVWVPAGGRITIEALPLRKMKLQYNSTISSDFNMIIGVAAEIRVKKKSINKWLDISPPAADQSVTAKWNFLLPKLAMRSTKRSAEIPVSFKNITTQQFKMAIVQSSM